MTPKPGDLFEILKSDSIKNILCIIAHPDDETGCSGLIAASVHLGIEVSILCMTRGEGGDRGIFSKEQIGTVRENELLNACKVLNVKNLWFMGYKDPEPENSGLAAPKYDSDQLTQELTRNIKESKADIVVTHGSIGEYGHPAHICLNIYVRKAVREINDERIILLTMSPWDPSHPMQDMINRYDYPSFQLNSSLFYEKRLKALMCHQTQLNLFKKYCGGNLKKLIKLSTVERYSQVSQ